MQPVGVVDRELLAYGQVGDRSAGEAVDEGGDCPARVVGGTSRGQHEDDDDRQVEGAHHATVIRVRRQ